MKIDQASLGLFDRDLLLKGIEDPSVAAYYKFMVDSAILLGAKKSDAEKQMQEVLDFEMNLANVIVFIFFHHENNMNLCLFYSILFLPLAFLAKRRIKKYEFAL